MNLHTRQHGILIRRRCRGSGNSFFFLYKLYILVEVATWISTYKLQTKKNNNKNFGGDGIRYTERR